jgi:hypothetical protein
MPHARHKTVSSRWLLEHGIDRVGIGVEVDSPHGWCRRRWSRRRRGRREPVVRQPRLARSTRSAEEARIASAQGSGLERYGGDRTSAVDEADGNSSVRHPSDYTGMGFNAEMLVCDDDGSLFRERDIWRDSWPARVALDVHPQHCTASNNLALKFFKRLQSEGRRAIGGSARRCQRAHAGREAILDNGHADQREAELTRQVQGNLESRVVLHAIGGA